MKFEEKSYLETDDNPNGSHEEACETFLAGDCYVAEWTEGESRYGDETHRLFPAWVKGERAWLDRWFWNASSGYCATGNGERIMPFQGGIEILINRGQWEMFETELD